MMTMYLTPIEAGTRTRAYVVEDERTVFVCESPSHTLAEMAALEYIRQCAKARALAAAEEHALLLQMDNERRMYEQEENGNEPS